MTVSAASAASRTPTKEQAAEVRAQLAVILASDSFSSSKRCQDFLAFVVEHALAGDFESLSERFLGVELFGRAVDYETATDSIVRVRANDVRRRLAQYYGQRSALSTRIDLIAGGYVPEFHWGDEVSPPAGSANLSHRTLSQADKETSDQRQTSEPKIPRKWFGLNISSRTLWWGAIAAVAVLMTVLLASIKSHPSNFDRFWQPVLEASGSPVLNLPSTDTLQLKLDPSRSLDALNELGQGTTLALRPEDMRRFHDWHVSMPVLQATLSVSLALGHKDKVPLVRIGTNMRRDELRGHPIIAIGSFSNPWTEQNVSGLRFTFDRGKSDRDPPQIRDAQNPNRSWSLPSTYPEPQTKDYAIITRTFDPITHEPFLSLAGLHSFGNQIAGEFVAQESSWNEVARRAPSGWEKMNMQILLETNIIGTTPSSPRIVDVYFWK